MGDIVSNGRAPRILACRHESELYEASQYEERLTERGNFLRQKLFNFLRGSGPSANEAHGGAL